MKYRMVDVGFSYYHVKCERRTVGRVWRGSDDMWRATIHKEEGPPRATPSEAFAEGAARALGYRSAAALRARNVALKQRQRTEMERGMAVVRHFSAARTAEERLKVLDEVETAAELTGVLRAFTHSLRRRRA